MRAHILGLALLLLLAGASPAAERKFDFGEMPLNQPPPGFFSTVAGQGKPGVWKVILDDVPLPLPPLTPNAPATAKKAVVGQLASDFTDEHFPMLVLGSDTYDDFTLTTRFKIVDGLTEQMAGIAFRIQDEKNFFVVRASALGGTVYFYKFEKGVRYPPVGNKLPVARGVWHDLTLECTGQNIHVLLDGKEAMPLLADQTFSHGKIGFWTKSDSISYFTDTRITYTPREPFVQSLVRDTLRKYPKLLGLKVFMLPAKSQEARLVASDNEKELGQPGEKTVCDVIGRGLIYYGKENEVVSVTMPLRDRNGDTVAAVRVLMKSFKGQTEESAIVRAMPIVKQMQQRVSVVDDLSQ